MEDVVGAGLTVASCKNLSPVIHVLIPFVGVSHCADIIAEHWRTGNFAGAKPLTAGARDSWDRRDLPALPGYLDSRIRWNERKEKPGGELLTARPRESGDPVIDPDSRLRGNDRLDLLHLPRAATAQAGALGRAWRRSCAPSAMNKSEAITAIKVSKTVCKMAPNTRPIMPAIEPVTMMPRPISAKTARSTASHGITATKKIAKIRSAQPLVSSSAAAGRARRVPPPRSPAAGSTAAP